MHPNTLEQEKAILVAIDTGEYDVEVSLEELELLAETADIQTLGQMIQVRPAKDNATFIGKGKLEELAEYVKTQEADLVIFDDELTASQIRNIEKACEVAVIDRTMLILDIFAERANTSEGRLQVELAQHRYLLPRLTGMGKSLSRLGGGGAGGGGARRGKGETKLELDRRHIRRHISKLEEELKDLEKRRNIHRERRKKDNVTTVAIVGYTNVGKSTLLNTLTNAGVLAENKLFATLDPTSRALTLPDGRTVMLVDTVGLVRRLPHHLVEAFKSTLEEAVFASLILNVCDISSPEVIEQMQVTMDILTDLGIGDTPILNVLNKSDIAVDAPSSIGEHSVPISAKTGKGLENLLKKVAELLPDTQKRLNLLIPYSKGGYLEEIRKEGKIISEEFKDDGVHIDAYVDLRLVETLSQYIMK